MPELLQASELLEAAIRIEKNGEAFYREIKNITSLKGIPYEDAAEPE